MSTFDKRSSKSDRRQLAAARKKFKRNRQPKGPRRRAWIPDALDPDQLDEWDGNEIASFERIMPLDERDRRRALEQAAFAGREEQADDGSGAYVDAEAAGSYADDEYPEEDTLNDFEFGNKQRMLSAGQIDVEARGTVVEVSSGLCRVDVGNVILLCSIRGTLSEQETGFTNAVAVGDQVIVHEVTAREDGTGNGVVEQVLPRRTLLARPDVFRSHLRQVVVANVDQLLIVASWREPLLWFELLDRYLIAAARNQLPAVICVNKIDLATAKTECTASAGALSEVGHSLYIDQCTQWRRDRRTAYAVTRAHDCVGRPIRRGQVFSVDCGTTRVGAAHRRCQ